MTTAQESAGRFALDEGKAREWIKRALDQDENGGTDQSLPDISEYYRAGSGDYAHVTARLVGAAMEAGILADPLFTDQATLAWEFIPSDGVQDAGYRWVLYTSVSDQAEGFIITAGPVEGMWALGDQSGMWSALAVLREAEENGNALVADLDSYVSSLPLAVRAPEIGELLARLPRGEWGSGELGTLANWLAEHGYDIGDEEEVMTMTDDYTGYKPCGHPEYRNTDAGPQPNDCGCDQGDSDN